MKIEDELIEQFNTDRFEYDEIAHISEVYKYQFPIVLSDKSGNVVIIQQGEEPVNILGKMENIHFYHVMVYKGNSVLHLFRGQKGIRSAHSTIMN